MSKSKLSLFHKRFRPLFLSLIFIATLAWLIAGIKKSGYHITYTVTPSVPRGWYLIVPVKFPQQLTRYTMVEFMPPPKTKKFLQENNWLPTKGTMLKYIFALPEDHVCLNHRALWINGKKVGSIYQNYAPNKSLPQTKFCGKLSANQYLLISNRNQRSFDSRYFGPVALNDIIGYAIPLKIEN